MKKKRKVVREEKLKISFRELDEGDASDFLKNSEDRDHDEVYYLVFHRFTSRNA